MAENVAAVRFTPYGPLVFCYTSERRLARGTRVHVELAGEVREGIVAIEPEQIISAPELAGAPRVIEAISTRKDSSGTAGIPAGNGDQASSAARDGGLRGDDAPTVPPGVVFLPAADGAIGSADLADALRLAALPVPEPPTERR